MDVENDLEALSSTYSALTADRILAGYGVHLSHDELSKIVKNTNSIYFQLLVVPFSNIINGIILQQANDYQVYLQKIFIDYFVSGSGNDNQETPGASVRADLEQNRIKLVEMSALFEEDKFTHMTLISESQAAIKNLVQRLLPLHDTEETANNIKDSLASFRERTNDIAQGLKNYRVEFKTLILDTLRLIQLLPDYREDPHQEAINRISLQFDDQLG